MELRPVLYAIGLLLCLLAVGMVVPMLADMYVGNKDWQVFFICIMGTAFFGGALALGNASAEPYALTLRQAFLLTTFSWLALTLFAAIPFWLCGLNLSFTDAFFESMSGITTTGATVIVGLDNAPPGILLWRAILQWLGGIGIIVMTLSVLPMLKVGGMQLLRTESSAKDKALPRTAAIARSILFIYMGLTLICAICYRLAGLSLFDSVAHAMTTIATGGFSTKDSSFSGYESYGPELVAIVFMTVGGMPFILYLKALHGNVSSLFKDGQVRWFLSIIAASTLTLAFFLTMHKDMPLPQSLVDSGFNVVSLMTGTGYTNHDYNNWGGFGISLLFFLMVMGGCAGSTTCGIKIFRFQVLYAVTAAQLKKLLYPHGVFIPHFDGRPVPQDAAFSVMGFFFMYAACFAALAIALSALGLDFITSLSGAATAISNVGPGMGDIIGPTGNFTPLPDSAKWLLSAGMILGRLELFTVLVLLSPHFWRR